VHYQPGGKAEAVVSGNPALLDHVRLEGGRLSLDCHPGWSMSKFDVSLSGRSSPIGKVAAMRRPLSPEFNRCHPIILL